MKQRRGISSPWKVVIRVGIFLLLGAMLNVAVAWGCAIWLRDALSALQRGGVGAAKSYHEGDVVRMWRVEVYQTPALSWTMSAWSDVTMWEDRPRDSDWSPQDVLPGWASRWDLPELRRTAHGDDESGGVVLGRGWPMVCLTCDFSDLGHPPFYLSSEAIDLGWPGGSASRMNPPAAIWLPRLLPLRVYGAGFAINTLFYAAILWLLLAAPFAFRRWRRIKRGLCPACAYPVGTSDLCTECGKPIPLSLRERVRVRAQTS